MPKCTVWVYCRPAPPMWHGLGSDPDMDPKRWSKTVANTNNQQNHFLPGIEWFRWSGGFCPTNAAHLFKRQLQFSCWTFDFRDCSSTGWLSANECMKYIRREERVHYVVVASTNIYFFHSNLAMILSCNIWIHTVHNLSVSSSIV